METAWSRDWRFVTGNVSSCKVNYDVSTPNKSNKSNKSHRRMQPRDGNSIYGPSLITHFLPFAFSCHVSLPLFLFPLSPFPFPVFPSLLIALSAFYRAFRPSSSITHPAMPFVVFCGPSDVPFLAKQTGRRGAAHGQVHREGNEVSARD
jgi:hypothetical protein